MEQLIKLLQLFIDKPYVWIPLVLLFITSFLIKKRFEFRKEKIEHFEKSSDFLKKIESFFAITEMGTVSTFQIEYGFFAYFGKKLSFKEIDFFLKIKNNAFYFFENYPKVKEYLTFDENTLAISEKYSSIKKNIRLVSYIIAYFIFTTGSLLLLYMLLALNVNTNQIIQISVLIVAAFGMGMVAAFEVDKIFKASEIVKLCKIR